MGRGKERRRDDREGGERWAVEVEVEGGEDALQTHRPKVERREWESRRGVHQFNSTCRPGVKNRQSPLITHCLKHISQNKKKREFLSAQ